MGRRDQRLLNLKADQAEFIAASQERAGRRGSEQSLESPGSFRPEEDDGCALDERLGPLAKRLEALGIRPIFSVPDVSRVYQRTALVEAIINGRGEEVPRAEAK